MEKKLFKEADALNRTIESTGLFLEKLEKFHNKKCLLKEVVLRNKNGDELIITQEFICPDVVVNLNKAIETVKNNLEFNKKQFEKL